MPNCPAASNPNANCPTAIGASINWPIPKIPAIPNYAMVIAPMTLRDLEMQAIYDALERHEGNKPAAAEELGVSLKTLYNKLNQAAESEKAA